jgi:Bacterial Ig domain
MAMKIEFAQYRMAKLQKSAPIINGQLKFRPNLSAFEGNSFSFEAIDPLTEARIPIPPSFASGPVFVSGSNSKYTESTTPHHHWMVGGYIKLLVGVVAALVGSNGAAQAQYDSNGVATSSEDDKPKLANQSGQAAVRIVSVNEEHSHIRFAASGLPPGLLIHPQTGVISGTLDREASRNNGAPFIIRVNMNDGNGASGISTIKLHIDNSPPVATDDILSLSKNPRPVNVLANDIDPNGDRLELANATAIYGAVGFTTSGFVTYTSNSDSVRADTISYQISDGHGGISTAKVEVIIE